MASEAQHQAYVIKWSQQPSIRRQWPELALLHHIPNGGTRDAVEAKHLKQQGVKPAGSLPTGTSGTVSRAVYRDENGERTHFR